MLKVPDYYSLLFSVKFKKLAIVIIQCLVALQSCSLLMGTGNLERHRKKLGKKKLKGIICSDRRYN